MSQSSKINTLTKNTAWVYIGKIGTQIFALITTILVIRKLDVDVYGTYSLLLKFIVIFNVFSTSPIGSVFDRYIPELIENHDNRRLRRLVIIGVSLIILSALIITSAIFGYSSWVSDFLNIPYFESYKSALLTYIILMLLREAMTSILTSSLLHKFTAIFLILSSFVRSILLVIFLDDLNVNTLLLIEAGSCLIYVIPGMVLLKSFINSMKLKTEVISKNPVSRKRILRYGMYSSVNELGAGIVGKTSDYFIISAISNLHNVGIYSFATKIYDLIFKLLPFREFLTVVRPLFFQKFSKDHKAEEFYNIYNFMVKSMIPVYILPVLYFIVFGKSLILYVFDPKYISAYLVCVLVLLSNIYYAFFFPVNLVIQLRERMDISLLSKVIVLFSIVAGIFAMKFYGIIGVATVTLIGDFSKNVFIVILLNRDIKIRYRFREYRNYLFIFLAINIPFFIISNKYPTMPVLIIGSLIYFPLTFIAIVKYHPFTNYDLGLLEKMGQSNRATRLMRRVILSIYNMSVFQKK